MAEFGIFYKKNVNLGQQIANISSLIIPGVSIMVHNTHNRGQENIGTVF